MAVKGILAGAVGKALGARKKGGGGFFLSIKVLGLEELLNQIANAEKIDLAPIIKRVGGRVMNTARDYAPVDTSELMKSISVRPLGTYSEGASIFTNKEYAPYQEFGTSKMPAANEGMGYMRVALDVNETQIFQAVAKFINGELKKL